MSLSFQLKRNETERIRSRSIKALSSTVPYKNKYYKKTNNNDIRLEI